MACNERSYRGVPVPTTECRVWLWIQCQSLSFRKETKRIVWLMTMTVQQCGTMKRELWILTTSSIVILISPYLYLDLPSLTLNEWKTRGSIFRYLFSIKLNLNRCSISYFLVTIFSSFLLVLLPSSHPSTSWVHKLSTRLVRCNCTIVFDKQTWTPSDKTIIN